VNRKELVSALADKAGVSQTDADKVLDAFQGIVFDVVSKEGEKLTLPGFLTFEQSSRSARTGRNPATGETIQIAASKTAKVSAGTKLKAAAAGK
jgi:DNA-binding protein HU-beta